MLHIVAWLAVYAVVLFVLGEAVRPYRKQRWFKVLFFPGVLIAVGVQAVASKLCVGGKLKFALLKSGEAALFMTKRDVPCLAGALFVLVSHALFYTLFFITVSRLENAVDFDARMISLPSLYPHDMLEGQIVVDVKDYIASLRESVDAFKASPMPYLVIFYLAFPVFANLQLRGREFFWAALLVVALGCPVYFADWLGLGFPFLSRGWWARFFYFPEWWGLFSLYVTMAFVALGLSCLLRVGHLIVHLFVRGPKWPRRRQRGQAKPQKAEREPVHASDVR